MRTSLRVIVIIIIAALVFGLFPVGSAKANFSARNTFSGQFADVVSSDWFADYVRRGYEFGLISGVSSSTFAPNNNLTIAQTLALAVRIHSIYTTGTVALPGSPPDGWNTWYEPYVVYAMNNGLMQTAFVNFNAPAQRHEVAVIFDAALPGGALPPIRDVGYGVIPDIDANADYAPAVYALYRAGILSGSDSIGTFNPSSNIRRSEIAAIIVRIADPSLRSDTPITPAPSSGPVLSAVEVAEIASPAVFTIQAYFRNGFPRGIGSGFFISPDGYAITNYHIVSGIIPVVVTQDGRQFGGDAVRIVDVDRDNDLVLLKVSGTGFPYLTLGNSGAIRQGQTVYAIGSPFGLENTISQGIISNVRRVIDVGTITEIAIAVIQTSAPAYPGSSGGALVDEFGRAVGVVTAGIGENITFAIPINEVRNLDRNAPPPGILWREVFYSGFSQAVDFGVFSGARIVDITSGNFGLEFIIHYDIYDFVDSAHFVSTLTEYREALIGLGFNHVEIDDFTDRFTSATTNILLHTDFQRGVIIVHVEEMPQFYADFPDLVDFGWFAGLTLYREVIHANGSVMRLYIWPSNFFMLLFVMEPYLGLMLDNSFRLVRYEDNAMLFENDNLSVVFVFEESREGYRVYLDILPLRPGAVTVDPGAG